VLSGFATLIGVLQNIMIQTMFSDPKFSEGFSKAPASVSFMAGNFKLIFAALLACFVVTLVSSIGLLKRRNWARLTFIGIMALGIVWNIGGLLLQFTMFSSFPSFPQAPHEADAFQSMFVTMMVFTAVVAVAFSVLFGWIIKRLISQPIAAEFIK
jgi:peptidoglycan/LPS O-acetylase OafA/YrhL